MLLHDAIINGERVTLFQQDVKTGYVWCQWEHVWSVLYRHHSDKYTDVQQTLKNLLEERLGWRVVSSPLPQRQW